MEDVLYALGTMGGLGIIFGVGLFIASRVFHVEEDPRVEQVTEALPGANCGGCGQPGCGALAKAIVHGTRGVESCPVCSLAQVEKIAEIMGVEVEKGVRKVAIVHCQGQNVRDAFTYNGPQSCRAAQLLLRGHKECPYGCLGFGDCVRACPFDAIHIVDGIAQVDEEKCTACGRCVAACPRDLIDLQPVDKYVHVLCRSYDKGAAVRKYCEKGCIACRKCEKICRFDAIHVNDFLAEIDYEKCTSCAACVKECPNATILNFRKARRQREKKEVS